MNKYKEKMEALQGYSVKESEDKSLGKEDIESIQRRLNCTLPDDYVDFLVDYGCFAFKYYVGFPILDPRSLRKRGLLNVFFGFLPNDPYDLIHNHETYKGRMPSDLIPIANDPGGNILCLSVKGQDEGTVYYWDHEEEEMVEEDEEPGYSNLYPVAKSFDDFINSLEIAKDMLFDEHDDQG